MTKVGTFGAAAVVAAALAGNAPANPAHAEAGPVPVVRHGTVEIDGVGIHYRAAGPENAPAILLLHGFPTSSHMFRDLIPVLAEKYRVIAPDYPGFGYSDAPELAKFDYSFGALASLIDKFNAKVGLKSYVIYMQDYGGPVGFRLAVAHPEQVRGIVVQNATAFVEGWNPDAVKQFVPFWQNRNAETEAPIRALLTAETTKFQYTHGESRNDRLNPDAWTHAQTGLDRPGIADKQVQYLFNYQDNVAQYPKWHEYLKTKRPPMLILWGKNDPFFTMTGVEKFKDLLPGTKVDVYDAGHFALETHLPEIATAVRKFVESTTR